MEQIEEIDIDKLNQDLWYRKRIRRKALRAMHFTLSSYASWNQSRVESGLPKRPFPVAELQAQLLITDAVAVADESYPLGPAAHWRVDDIVVIPIDISYKLAIVRDTDIPEPWQARYSHFAGPRAKLPQGTYAWDWQEFLRTWKWEVDDFLVRLPMRIKAELDKPNT